MTSTPESSTVTPRDGLPVDEAPTTAIDTRTVVAAQRKRYGGIKWGSAFFGWLAALGTAALLAVLGGAIYAGFGFTPSRTDPTRIGEQVGQTVQDPGAITASPGAIGVVATLVVVFVAYLAGGYVAGRMARFDGVKQGFAVWLWSILTYAVVVALGFLGGAAQSATLPKGMASTAGIVAVLVVLVVGLVGAMLGGLTGMRFHRRVDRA